MVNRRQRRSRRPRAYPARVKRMITRTDTGFKFVPRSDPPDFVVAPWWPLTVKMSIEDTATETVLTPKDITAAVILQTGLKDAGFDIRVYSIRVWGLKSQAISMVVYDTIGDNSRWNNLSDMGTPINYSRLGWKFGAVASLQSHSGTASTTLAKIKGAAGTALVYVQIMLTCNSAASAYDLFGGCESDPPSRGAESRFPCLDSMSL